MNVISFWLVIDPISEAIMNLTGEHQGFALQAYFKNNKNCDPNANSFLAKVH